MRPALLLSSDQRRGAREAWSKHATPRPPISWRCTQSCVPVGEVTPQVDILGPKSRRWGEVPHRRYGVRPGQRRGQLPSSVYPRHRAVKQGQSRGSVGTTSKGKGRGCRGVRIGQAGEGGHKVVRGRWGPPAADSNTTRRHASPPPPPPRRFERSCQGGAVTTGRNRGLCHTLKGSRLLNCALCGPPWRQAESTGSPVENVCTTLFEPVPTGWSLGKPLTEAAVVDCLWGESKHSPCLSPGRWSKAGDFRLKLH